MQRLEIKICPKSQTKIFEQAAIEGTLELSKNNLSKKRMMELANELGKTLMMEHFKFLSSTQFHFISVTHS